MSRSRMFYLLLVSLLTLLLSSCMPAVHEYRHTTPELRLRTFFDGELKAWGMVQDWRGRITRRFTVEMVGVWEGHNGTLTEHFLYDDGEQQTRIWHLEEIDDTRVRGHASDVAGEATGEQHGAALNWRYTLNIKSGEQTYAVDFDDWMVLVDRAHLLNRASLDWYGIPAGEVTLLIEKIEKGKMENQK